MTMPRHKLFNPNGYVVLANDTLRDKRRSTEILATELLRQDLEQRMAIPELLRRHGYEFRDGVFVPIAVMDPRERAFLPVRPVMGIVKLTHHKLRQPQDMCSGTSPEYPIWWLGPSATS